MGTNSLELGWESCEHLHESFACRWRYLKEDRGWEAWREAGRGVGRKEEGRFPVFLRLSRNSLHLEAQSTQKQDNPEDR